MVKKLQNFQDLLFLRSQLQIEKEKASQQERAKRSLFANDYYSEIVYRDQTSPFETSFTDAQVANILEKVSNRNVRSLVREFRNRIDPLSSRSLHLKYILHTICMKLKSIYGSKMLSFIHDIQIGHRDAEIIAQHSNLSLLQLDEELIEFETLQLTRGNTKRYVGFELCEYDYRPYMIVCDSQRYLQGRINEWGYVEDEFIKRMRFNIFEFFSEANYSYYKVVLNTRCIICNRELTNHDSVYYGIGPICRGDIHRY